MTDAKTSGSKKKRSSSKEFLEGYQRIWKGTAPVKYEYPNWVEKNRGNGNGNR